jgi:hypothetical protein
LWNGGDDGDNENKEGQILLARGDFDLENRVAGTLTEDASVLEFDVYCPNGQLEFEYQFGSEEYDEWVGDYNDSFMVTIDGAVVTWVPDGSEIVAVNSINNGNPGAYPPVPAINRYLFLDDNTDIDPMVAQPNQPYQVEYDGMTIRLRSHVLVRPGTTHRVRFVIADVNDGQYDSGLFVSQGSFRTIKPQP